MRHVGTLLGRELAAYFLGPMAYLVLLAFQLIAALNFWDLVDVLGTPHRELSSLRDPMNTYIPGSPAFWFAILASIPLLTMRLFAEERRQGTIESILTVPVTETEVVVAKWLAGVLMYCALLVPFFLYLPFLYYQGKFDFDLGPIMSLCRGPLDDGDVVRFDRLIPELAHAKSDHRCDLDVVSLLFLIVIIPIAYVFAAQRHYSWADGIRFVAVYYQIQSFGQGLFDFRYIAVQLSACVFMLSLTVRVLEMRTKV